MTSIAHPTPEARQARWHEEARFFDAWADRQAAAPLALDPEAWRRYSRPRLRRRFNKEFRLRLLGDVRGKTILDVGCGDGGNAVLLARLGARVTGLDVSPGAIRVAERRAAANGVADRMRLVCSPVETADLEEDSFDVVWGEAILHHLIDELDLVLRHLVRWTRPGGMLLFAEPLNFNRALRRLRKMIPIVTEATPGERPLERGEIELLRRHVPDLEIRLFHLLGRLDPFILGGFNYERSSPWRRAIVNLTDAADYCLLSLPPFENLGGVGVLYGRPAKDGGRAAARREAASAS